MSSTECKCLICCLNSDTNPLEKFVPGFREVTLTNPFEDTSASLWKCFMVIFAQEMHEMRFFRKKTLDDEIIKEKITLVVSLFIEVCRDSHCVDQVISIVDLVEVMRSKDQEQMLASLPKEMTDFIDRSVDKHPVSECSLNECSLDELSFIKRSLGESSLDERPVDERSLGELWLDECSLPPPVPLPVPRPVSQNVPHPDDENTCTCDGCGSNFIKGSTSGETEIVPIEITNSTRSFVESVNLKIQGCAGSFQHKCAACWIKPDLPIDHDLCAECVTQYRAFHTPIVVNCAVDSTISDFSLSKYVLNHISEELKEHFCKRVEEEPGIRRGWLTSSNVDGVALTTHILLLLVLDGYGLSECECGLEDNGSDVDYCDEDNNI